MYTVTWVYGLIVALMCSSFEDNGREISPKLLEVNFMGDWLGVKNALTERYGHESEEAQTRYLQWAEDMLCVLATNVDLTAHPRLKRLDHPKRYRNEDSLQL